jgi:tRNA (guanine37-N1)-methyltransferase
VDELGATPQTTPSPAVRFDVLSLFPGMFTSPMQESILKRAQAAGRIAIAVHDVRDWTTDRHRTADDTPYGGGAGMVLRAPPLVDAFESLPVIEGRRVLLMAAGGRPFDQAMAHELATAPQVVLICGHYEGIDERAIEEIGAEPVTIGDYVLTGGELPAMVIIDAVSRLVAGVIDAESIAQESFGDGLVEYPHYTRPANFRGRGIPDVLLSGHHARIAAWRREQSIRRTAAVRPDLLRRTLDDGELTPKEADLAAELLTAREQRFED